MTKRPRSRPPLRIVGADAPAPGAAFLSDFQALCKKHGVESYVIGAVSPDQWWVTRWAGPQGLTLVIQIDRDFEHANTFKNQPRRGT